MQPGDVADTVLEALADETGQAVPHLVEIVPLAISYGIENDSDAVFVTIFQGTELICGLMVGCSLLVGTAIREYLEQYHDHDAGKIVETVDGWIADVEVRIAQDLMSFFSLRQNEVRWRSFRGERLISYEELLIRSRRELN